MSWSISRKPRSIRASSGGRGWIWVEPAPAFFYLSPLAGRGRIASSDAIRVRGTLHESECVESPPHPDPLPASGEREKRLFRHEPRFLHQRGVEFVVLLEEFEH